MFLCTWKLQLFQVIIARKQFTSQLRSISFVKHSAAVFLLQYSHGPVRGAVEGRVQRTLARRPAPGRAATQHSLS